jgi:alpha-glucosidase
MKNRQKIPAIENRTPFFAILIYLLLSPFFASCRLMPNQANYTIYSPDRRIEVHFDLDENGAPFYKVDFERHVLLEPSRLGFILKDQGPLNQGFIVKDIEHSTFDETWEQPWGEVRFIHNHYNEMRIRLQEESGQGRDLVIVFRAFDDGLGFRYEFPQQPNLAEFIILDELTEFNFAEDHHAWWIPAYREHRYEYEYQRSLVSLLKRVHTPLTIETSSNLFLAIHEANLTNYPSMVLQGDGEGSLKSDLVPWRGNDERVKAFLDAPHLTPWRTLQIAEKPGDLITSYLILNLNEPNALGDVSWVKPAKYIGIWWAIHLGRYSWGSGADHGATTERAKRYIDFAAEYGFDGVLIEGWNLGWDGDWFNSRDAFDFRRAYEDFDLEGVAQYAKEKGVRLIGHHETGGDVKNYENQMEDAFALYEDVGVDTVKTGYASVLIDDLEWHHGQRMVLHHQEVVELAARHKIMLDVHEPVKDTGLRRTYPNLMTREGVRGMEWNAWSQDGGNAPEHTTVIPFTRMLSGPLDYTPGIFHLTYQGRYPDNRVRTTLAKQLALMVVLYSPLQMAADMPENYVGHPAFQFIVDVPVDWEDTLVLNGEIGEYVTVARKDRLSEDWYIGAITDENGCILEIKLPFLETDVQYLAEIYADGAEANWETKPHSYEIRQELVDSSSILTLTLAPGGGQAIRLRPATSVDVQRFGGDHE